MDIWARVLEGAAAAILGALAALVTFRTRITLLEVRREDDRAIVTEIRKDVTALMKTVEQLERNIYRRQLATMTMIASVARKVGADVRGIDDVLTRALTEDTDDLR